MQQFTCYEFLQFDRIAFAHTLSATEYHYALDAQGYSIYGPTPENGGVLEIGFVEKNPIILSGTAGAFCVEEKSIFILPPGSRFSVRARDPGVHIHTSVEYLLRCRTRPADGFSPPQGQTFTLPLVLPYSAGSQELLSMIRNIANAKAARLERSWLEECGELMMLIGKLCALAGSQVPRAQIPPSNLRYCTQAKTYISENIHKHLPVGEIAHAIGISKNYLTNIFKTCEGVTITEYANRCKLGYMLELMRRYDYSISQACAHVGFADADYVSRIFKKYYGMTVSQYRNTILRTVQPEKSE